MLKVRSLYSSHLDCGGNFELAEKCILHHSVFCLKIMAKESNLPWLEFLGRISTKELPALLETLGLTLVSGDPADEEMKRIIAAVDKDGTYLPMCTYLVSGYL